MSDDRTPEWRRGMKEAADLLMTLANDARAPSPFNDGDRSVERAEAYELAHEMVARRLSESPLRRAEKSVYER